MNENNTPKTPEEKAAAKAAREAAKQVYTSLDDARASKPTEGSYAKWTLYRVTDPQGEVYYTWNFGREAALLNVVRQAGWTVADEGKAPTKEKVGDLLKQLSDEDRAVLIAQFVPTSPKRGRKAE